MVINRLRAGHTYLTHVYLITKEIQPKCGKCDETLTVAHIFECTAVRRKSYEYFNNSTTWQKDLFDYSKYDGIKKFLYKNDYYHLI